MKTQLLAVAIGGLTLSAGVFAQDKAKDVNQGAVVSEIDVKHLRAVFATPQSYRLLRINAEVLPKVISDKEDQTLLKKQVDFSKQQLVLFAWSSGGDDKLTYIVEKGGTLIIFRYEAGREKNESGRENKKEPGMEKRQQKSQVRAFAIPRDAPWATNGWPFVDPHSIPKPSSPR